MSLASMMSGRIGSLTGNVLLPVLLDFGCVLPFGTLAFALLCKFIILLLLVITLIHIKSNRKIKKKKKPKR